MYAAEILRRLLALAPGQTTRVNCAQWSGASRNDEQPEQSGCWEVDAISREGNAARGNDQFCRDTNWR